MNDKSNKSRLEDRITFLRNEVKAASQTEDYERAADLREELARLEQELASFKNERAVEVKLEIDTIDQDVQFEIDRRNFVRAVMLAQQHQYSLSILHYLQKLALKRYAFDYRNAAGLRKLIEWYVLSKAEVKRILNEGLEEYKGYTGVQYDIEMGYVTLREWVDNFLNLKW